MDGENTPLIGAHGYCSQEMVNLLLTGRAVSNTFDGHITLSESGVSRSHENDIKGSFNIVQWIGIFVCFIRYRQVFFCSLNSIFCQQINVAAMKLC